MVRLEVNKMEGNKPTEKFRAGNVTATVWENKGKTKDGKEYSFFSVSVERNFKNDKDEWKSTNSFMKNDLPKLSLVVAKAFEHLSLNKDDKEE
jgi:hypothetical protein